MAEKFGPRASREKGRSFSSRCPLLRRNIRQVRKRQYCRAPRDREPSHRNARAEKISSLHRRTQQCRAGVRRSEITSSPKAEPQNLLAVPEAAFEFAFLISLFGRSVRGLVRLTWFAALGEREKFCKPISPGFRPDFPEIFAEIRNFVIKTGDRFDVHWNAGTRRCEFLEVSFQVHVPVAHCRPLDRRAIGAFPNGGITQAARHNVRW